MKEEAFHDAPTRVRFVQTARWVEFARGRLALEELERRYQYPSCARMPCMRFPLERYLDRLLPSFPQKIAAGAQ